MAGTWDIATVVNFALSGGALIATTTGFFTPSGVRGTVSQGGGKLYFEDKITTLGSATMIMGICNASRSFSASSDSINAAGLDFVGTVVVNNTNFTTVGALGARATNDVIGIAVDLTANLLWARICPAGNWNGNAGANPLAGIGGANIAAIHSGSNPMWPALMSNSGTGAASAVTANFGDSSFVGVNPWPTAIPGSGIVFG
jgi:hypothetical protein